MTELLKLYGSNLKISGPFHTLPFEWYSATTQHDSSKILRHITSKPAQKVLKRKIFLAAATIIAIIVQEIFGKRTSGQDTTLFFMLTFLLISCNCYVCVLQIKATNIANFLNGLIQFDKMYPSKPVIFAVMSLQELACMVMAKAAFSTGIVIPIGIVLGFHWTNPWKTSLAGYWLIPGQNDQENGALYEFVQILCKLCVLSFNLWLWMFVIAAPVFAAGVLHTLSITILLGYIQT